MPIPPWAPDRRKWPMKCTPAAKGWVRWYRGRTRYIAPKSIPLDQLEAACRARLDEIDKEIAADRPVGTVPGYRDALSEYLAVQKDRIGAPRNGIQQRTYDNLVAELNKFGRFVVDGRKVADRQFGQIGPREFSAYARSMKGWKGSGFDSVVSRVSGFFRWAEGMGYAEAFRPGPEFVRPGKSVLRDERIDAQFSYAAAEIAKLYLAGNHTMQCWIALGVCCAFNNADVAHVTRTIMGLDKGGVIDYRRRKKGKVRRVIPLPTWAIELLKRYDRPDPTDAADADLFFVSRNGRNYAKGKNTPGTTISRLWTKLEEAAGIEKLKGRGFKGLRTSFFNLAPRTGYETERKIVMGRAKGTVDLDSYLEDVGLERLRELIDHVWAPVQAEIDRLSTSRQGADPSAAVAAAAAS